MDKEKYQLRYITLPKEFYSDNRLNATELKVLAFIYSYTQERFYFSNENIAEMFSVSPRSVSSAIGKLEKYGYITTNYDISAGGGTIRFINRLEELFSSDRKKSSSQTGRTLPPKDNKKKENKKKDIGFDAQTGLKRKNISYPKETYKQILDEYQRLKGITLQGNEFQPVQQTIKSMFLDGRTAEQILAVMHWLQDSSAEWTDNWTMRTVRMKLPELVAKIRPKKALSPEAQAFLEYEEKRRVGG